jgi:hypothetical protein
VNLNKALDSTTHIEVRLYPNGSSTYTVLGTLDGTLDGAIADKNIRTFQTGIDNLAIGYAWKMPADTSVMSGVIGTNVEYNKITTL